MRKLMLLTGTTRNGSIMYLMKNRGMKKWSNQFKKKLLGHFARRISWENSTLSNRNINLQRFWSQIPNLPTVFYKLAVDSKYLNLVEHAFFQDFTYIHFMLFRSQPLKVIVRKIAAAFGSASGVAMDIAQYANRNWRSALLILSPQECSWFIFDWG